MSARLEYSESIEWLEQLYSRPHLPASVVELSRAEFLLRQLGDPQNSFKSVHVAGTTGKGSTTTMIGGILQASGIKVGVFRSPHLYSYRERMAVDERTIDEEMWVRSFLAASKVARGMEAGVYTGYTHGRPTLFEVLFAMTSWYFRESGVQWAALETGMGGRLDATNTVQSSVAVITNVSREHTQVLGETLEAIAAEKAAIVKGPEEVVTTEEQESVLGVIQERVASQQAHMQRLNQDFCFHTESRSLSSQDVALEDATARLTVTLSTGAAYAAVNASAAFAAARALSRHDVTISDREVIRGLQASRIPGRFEVVGENPLVILDGAQSVAGMHSLRRSLQGVLPEGNVVLLFTAMADKDSDAMASAIGDAVQSVVLTRAPGTNRAAGVSALGRSFDGKVPHIMCNDDPDEALALALRLAAPSGTLIIAGSLYLVGWARQRFIRREIWT